jgi:sialate O-acetylesterase
MNKLYVRFNLALFLTTLFPLISIANIRLPSVIGSNMVLQQQSKVKLWGWASPAEKIVITPSWSKTSDTVIATRDAVWQIAIQTPKAGGPYTITLKANNTIVLENVLIGEVWVCSGQSNMEMSWWSKLKDIADELPTAANPDIRFFHIPKSTSEYPQDDCNAKWTLCDSNTLKSFSAVGYFFGKRLNKELNVPIGLINSNWGGTSAEVWAEKESIESDPELKAAAGKIAPAPWWPYLPGKTFNAMIAPITNFSIAGTIWYQGEGNTGFPDTYSKTFTTMIDSWRRAWEKEFPFYYVQIAPYAYETKYAGARIQEQQTIAQRHKNVGMIVITDLIENNPKELHPANKHDVGYRLANYALGQTYGKNGIAYKSPFYKGMAISKDRVIVQFDNAPNGLVSKDKTITELYIAGADKVFYPAQATIDKDKLVVWSKQVKEPVAVRFAFSNTAVGNLFSKEGLPVGPFRTDDWELQ